MGFRGGVKLTPPPSVSWFSSTPAGIGLNGVVKCPKNDNTHIFRVNKVAHQQCFRECHVWKKIFIPKLLKSTL